MLVSNASVLRRAPPSLLVVGSLHLVALWALMNGLNIHPLATQSKEMVASVIDQAPLPPDKPPTVVARTSEIKFTPPVLKEMVRPLAIDPDLPPPTITTSPPIIGEIPGGSAELRPVIATASVDPRHPLTQPSYPMEARHFGEQGRLLLAILVGADGRVLDAKATQSSGSERLDQAAIKEARQHWRLRPATRNGVPFEQWLTVPVVFQLEEH